MIKMEKWVTAIVIVKLLMDGYKCFSTFNTVPFKQKLPQLVLWHRQTPLKKQDYNYFPQVTTIPFKFIETNTVRMI